MRLFQLLVEALQRPADKLYDGQILNSEHNVSVKDFAVNQAQQQAIHMDVKSMILEHIEDTHFFILTTDVFYSEDDEVIESDPPISHAWDRIKTYKTKKGFGDLDYDVAPPFKTCWFQLPDYGPHFLSITHTENADDVFGIWIHELGKDEYLFSFVIRNLDPELGALVRFKFGIINRLRNPEYWNTMVYWLQPFSKLKGGYTGAVKSIPGKIKYRHPKTREKRFHKLRRVIMIYPKAITLKQKQVISKRDHVDFTHRFEVQSHWRRLFFLDGREDENGHRVIDFNRIGKDRDGEYCVPGFTYVEEGVKGDEHLPLVRKTRVIHGPQSKGDKS